MVGSEAVAFSVNSRARRRVHDVLVAICSSLGRGNCGPVGRVINCVLSRSPACVAARGGTHGLVEGVSHSALLRSLIGCCLGTWLVLEARRGLVYSFLLGFGVVAKGGGQRIGGVIVLFSSEGDGYRTRVGRVLAGRNNRFVSSGFVKSNGGSFAVLDICGGDGLRVRGNVTIFLSCGRHFGSRILPGKVVNVYRGRGHATLRVFGEGGVTMVYYKLSGGGSVALSDVKGRRLFTDLREDIRGLGKRVVSPYRVGVGLAHSCLPFSMVTSTTVLVLGKVIPGRFWYVGVCGATEVAGVE